MAVHRCSCTGYGSLNPTEIAPVVCRRLLLWGGSAQSFNTLKQLLLKTNAGKKKKKKKPCWFLHEYVNCLPG